MPRVIIVGAGISGLSLAFRLSQRRPDLEVVVLEERDRPGGTIWTEARDGFRLEWGPNGFLDNKSSTITLCRDLGLGDRLQPASLASSRNRFLFYQNRLQRLPTGFLSFLASPLLSWRGKIELLGEQFRRVRRDERDESIAGFVRRRAGKEAAAVLADAFVTGIFAGDPERISVHAAFPRLVAFEREHGSLLRGFAAARRHRRDAAKARGEDVTPRGTTMWSFADGLRVLVEELCRRLPIQPRFGVGICRVERTGDQANSWRVVAADGSAWTSDSLVLTCPAYRQAGLVAGLDTDLAALLEAIPFNRVAVVGLGYRAGEIPVPLDGFGYIAPQHTRRNVLGVQWCSSIFPGRAPEGMVLLRALCGGWHRPDIVSWEDLRLLDAVRDEVRLALGVSATPSFCQIVRWDRAIPQYVIGHLDLVRRVDQRLIQHPGLFLGGNAFRGVAMNDCTEQATVLAEKIASRHGQV